jgi:hypothetical protein
VRRPSYAGPCQSESDGASITPALYHVASYWPSHPTDGVAVAAQPRFCATTAELLGDRAEPLEDPNRLAWAVRSDRWLPRPQAP